MQPLAVPLTRQLPRALEIYTDVLLHPSFPEKELERLRIQQVSALLRRSTARRRSPAWSSPSSSTGRPTPTAGPTRRSRSRSLTRDDVVSFYKNLFVPNNAALIVVGDTTPDAIMPVLESALKDWKPGSPVPGPSPSRRPPSR